MDNIVISPRGVHKLLSNLNAHKATGPDAISARFLKELAEEITPADWRIAHFVPIFKKGDKSAAANYRPISLMSICSKMLEHILHSNIMDHFERNSILTPAQPCLQNDLFNQRYSPTPAGLISTREVGEGLADGFPPPEMYHHPHFKETPSHQGFIPSTWPHPGRSPKW